MEPNTSNDSPTEDALVEKEATETEVGEEDYTFEGLMELADTVDQISIPKEEAPSLLEEALTEINRLRAQLEAKVSKPKKAKKELTTDEQVIVDTHFTPAEVAVELGVPDRNLRKAIRGGSVNAVKVGGRWFISSNELNRIKEAMISEAEAEAEDVEAEAEDVEVEAEKAEIKAHEDLVEAIEAIPSS